MSEESNAFRGKAKCFREGKQYSHLLSLPRTLLSPKRTLLCHVSWGFSPRAAAPPLPMAEILVPPQYDECALSPPGKSGHTQGGTSQSPPQVQGPVDDGVLLSPPSYNSSLTSTGGTRRGSHARTEDMAQRRSWQETVEEHMSSLPNLLSKPCCSSECTGCDTASWTTLSIIQQCAQASFGEAVILPCWKDEQYDWSQVSRTLMRNQQATANWFKMLFNMRQIAATSGDIHIDFHILGHKVCYGTWRTFHGVPLTTMATMERVIRNNQMVWNTTTAKEAAMALRSELANLTTSAEQWWYIRLDYYELIVESSTKYAGIIQHPHNIDWKLVYDEEFVPEMRCLGFDWASSDKTIGSEGSRSTWYAGRNKALHLLAKDRLGDDAKPFLFQSRKKHSAYVSVTPQADTHCIPNFIPNPTPNPTLPSFVCTERVPHMPKVEAVCGGSHKNPQESISHQGTEACIRRTYPVDDVSKKDHGTQHSNV